MKRFHFTSKFLFKGTVALLAIPGAVLVPIVAGWLLFQHFTGNGIAGFVFALRLRDLEIAAAVLGLIVLLFVSGRRLLRCGSR
ncbi:MAG: hypothetical protein ABJC10_10415 [Acidobacteriota bacterium]